MVHFRLKRGMVLAFVVGGVALGVGTLTVLSYFPGQQVVKPEAQVQLDGTSSDSDSSDSDAAPTQVGATGSTSASQPRPSSTVRRRRQAGGRPASTTIAEGPDPVSEVMVASAASSGAPAPVPSALQRAVFGTDSQEEIDAIIAKARRKAERQVCGMCYHHMCCGCLGYCLHVCLRCGQETVLVVECVQVLVYAACMFVCLHPVSGGTG
jgi:hypothetical protein